MAHRSSIATLSSAFPAPPVKGEARRGSGAVPQGAEKGEDWKPVLPAARPRGHGRSTSMGGISSAEREAVQLKRYSVYIPDDLKLPHDSLPSPPTTPPDEQQIPRRLSHQLSSTTAKHPFPAPPSSFALAHRRRSLVSFSPPLSPPSAAPADQALPGHFSPSSTTSESRPPSTTTTRPFSRSNTSSARISASPVQPQRPAPSRVKRKPVPQIEEDMEVVDDPLWDPTTGKRASRSKERTAMDSTGVEGQLRRLSVEERASGHPIFDSRAGASSGTEARATKPLPRANPPLLFAPQAPSTPLDMAPVIRRSGFTFGAPLPVASSASSVEDRDSATTSRVSSFSNERLSVDTDDRSLCSVSSCAGAASSIATSPSLDSWTPSTSSTSSLFALAQPTPSSKRVFRPFALLRRKQSQPNISLDSISGPFEAQAPSASSNEEDELDRWMGIMGGAKEEEEEPAPRAVSRPFRTLTAAERASRAAARLSILGGQRYGAAIVKRDDTTSISPLVFSVPPLVYSSSSRSSSSREGSSVSSRPRTLADARLSALRQGMLSSAEGSEESGLDGEDELSVEGEGGGDRSLEDFVDAPSSRRPSTSSSLSSSFTDGSLIEVIGVEPRSEGLDTMMEVEEPSTPNPNHSVHATPKATTPPSPVTSTTATMAAPPSLFSAFSWTPDEAPSTTRTSTSTHPISLSAPSDDEQTSSRATSPEPALRAHPVEGKRRTSATPRPPKPPKSPRRGSKASSGASSSIENVLRTTGDVDAVESKVGLTAC